MGRNCGFEWRVFVVVDVVENSLRGIVNEKAFVSEKTNGLTSFFCHRIVYFGITNLF